ncbi:MAG: DUF364 domain-containing protein [Anaerolineae bacterium]|nr:DUF364 domain-containing protein [Anaerolineae bacterium]
MNVLQALIDQCQHAAHVQHARVCDVRIGLRWTAVAVEKNGQVTGGIASTVQRTPEHTVTPPMPLACHLTDRRPLELAELVFSDNPLETGVGMATISALLEVDETRCTALNAGDIILQHGAGKRVVIIGHFPFIPAVRAAADTLWVLEQNPRDDDDLPAVCAPEIIPQADVVGITGMTLVNHTFESLAKLCRPDALVLVLGGSTPLSPVLLDYGVDIVAGTRVVDVDAVLQAVSQGAGFRQIPGKRLLTIERPAG